MIQYRSTQWKNPTDTICRLELFVSPGNWMRVDIKPGETVSLPAEFDDAIHQKSSGKIVGGLGHMLTHEGQTEKIHDSLLAPRAEDNPLEASLKTQLAQKQESEAAARSEGAAMREMIARLEARLAEVESAATEPKSNKK